MNSVSYQTVSVNKATASKEWVIVDADGQSLGRLCSKVAKLLRGKYKPSFTPHVDCGDNVSPRDLQKKGSDRLFRKVVKGMLPKNKLGDKLLNNLYVYEGSEHAHTAQQPRTIDINTLK